MTDTPPTDDAPEKEPDQEEPVTEPAPQPEPDEQQPPEPERAEVVKRDEPGADVVPINPRDTALDRAAEAALAMPGIPGRDEFLSLAMQARILSMSGLTPKAIRGNPHNAFYIAMVGRDLGLSPTAAIELIDVIGAEGKERASLSPQLMNAQVRRLGLGEIIPILRTADRCVAGAFGPGGADRRCRKLWAQGGEDHVEDCDCDLLGTTEYTWDDAKMAGLVGVNCKPGEHGEMCAKRESADRFKCAQGWKTYPKRMLWWRAGGYAADDYFPEAGLGLYSPEELGAMVDAEGRPIDPETVALPDGYEPKAVGAGSGRAGAATDDEMADPHELAELWIRARALPDEQQTALRERWKSVERLQGWSLGRLPANRVQLATSVLRGIEGDATKAGWDKDAGRHAVREALAHGLLAAFGVPAQDGPESEPEREPDAPAPEPGGDPESDAQAPETVEQPTLDAATTSDDDLFAAVGNAPDAVVDAVVAELKPMRTGEIDALLGERKASTDGDLPTRKRRLAAILVAERLAEQDESST